MLVHFAAPVLSVAADAVRDLQGEAAIFALWNVFTKCKDSLQDGHRLENISWRMWHRELSIHHPTSNPSSYAITPSSENKRPVSLSPSPVFGDLAEESPKGNPSLSYQSHKSNSVPTRYSLTVGRIIFDRILAEKISLSLPRKQPAIDSKLDTIPPSASSALIPTVLYPSTPPSVPCPKVVIVNPTPHPTPPATPMTSHRHHLLGHDSISQLHLPTTVKSGHLAPPSRSTDIQHPTPMTQSPPDSQASSSHSEMLSLWRSASPQSNADDALKPVFGSVTHPRFFLKESPERGDSSPDANHAAQGGDAAIVEGTSSHGDSSIAGKSVSSGKAPSSISSTKAGSTRSRSGKGVITTVIGAAAQKKRAALPGRHARPVNHRNNSRFGQKRSKSSANVFGAAAANSTMMRSPSAKGEKGETLSPQLPSPAHQAAPSRLSMQRKASDKSASRSKAAPQQHRQGIVMDGSSTDFESTDSEDDSEWAYEDISPAEAQVQRRKTKRKQDDDKARLQREREEEDRREREKDMFAKLPRTSYIQLPGISTGPGPRTRSVGLLSQLLNPDPSIFPLNYYTSFSTQDMTQFSRGAGSIIGRSSAAVPLASPTTVHAPPLPLNGNASNHGRGNRKYRPRAKPEGAELDDDSGDDENKVALSMSLAQQRLAALAGPDRRRRRPQELEKLDQRQLPAGGPPQNYVPVLSTGPIVPIPLAHPYNLPTLAAPSTPRTTRRQMLATELSESLRRNLLWERQISKIGGNAPRRRGDSILGTGGLRPLTTMNAPPNGEGGHDNGQDHITGVVSGDEATNRGDSKEERRRKALARNRSWADEYHYSGW